jgi:hypothetical protein
MKYNVDRFRHHVAACAFLSVAPLMFAQTPAPLATPPSSTAPLLFANLTMPFDISRARVGTHIEARATDAWAGYGCNLRVGALVEGHVSLVHPRTKADKASAFALVFDSAECDRHRGTPLKATIIALLGPPGGGAPNGESGMGQTPPLTDVPNSIGGGFRKTETPSSVYGYSIPSHGILPAQWKVGTVIDVPMHLSVGTGADGGSIIWTTNKDARLEDKTTLILVVAP